MKILIDLSEFYSYADEQRFFNGLKDIPGVQKIKGVDTSLCLTLNIAKLNREGFFDLVGLLRRYMIPLKPLAVLSEKSKFNWIREPRWYWTSDMFD
ncbi:hypothetical protein [Massilia rhizosphaerae]|uniref:hypothetical protein n=1 Tax=Massilia rhizosphaerae TaxID=2784389 RepID=UPI0018DC2A88|nr:hypothetical protein [Massilia rhizosphaerae]